MKKFWIFLILSALGLGGTAENALARENLSLTFDLAALETRETDQVRLGWTGDEFRMEAFRENLLWFQYFTLPKNAAFRHRFSLETEVSWVKDHGVAGLALGNREVDLAFYVYVHNHRGYARIATADSIQTNYVVEKTLSYPSVPFTLGIVYDVAQRTFSGLVNGHAVVSLSASAFPRLTRISSVTAVALVGGSRFDQTSGAAGFRSFALEAE